VIAVDVEIGAVVVVAADVEGEPIDAVSEHPTATPLATLATT